MAKLISHRPRYIQLAQMLMDDIASGKHSVGTLLPTEFELAEKYSTSRHTVREALRRLIDMGLITRHPGVGTRVQSSEPRIGYVQTNEGTSDLKRYVRDLALTIDSCRMIVIDEALAEFLPATPGHEWMMAQGLRHSALQRSPIATCVIYLAPPYADLLTGQSQLKAPIYKLIEERYGIALTEVNQTIEAATLTADEARRLQCDPSEPALRVERRYYSQWGELVEVAINLHPASRFVYRSTLHLGAAG